MNISIEVDVEITQDEIDGYVLSGSYMEIKTVSKLLYTNNEWLVSRVTDHLNAEINQLKKRVELISAIFYTYFRSFRDTDNVLLSDKYESFKDLSNSAQLEFKQRILEMYHLNKDASDSTIAHEARRSYPTKELLEVINR